VENTIITYERSVAKTMAGHRYEPQLRRTVEIIAGRCEHTEQVDIRWWYESYIYIEVTDRAFTHKPCGHRFLVSFDLTNGKIASLESANRYVFARKGWNLFADRLVGRTVSRGGACQICAGKAAAPETKEVLA
jgi:hypothetical protein